MEHVRPSPDPEAILAVLAEPARALLEGLDDGISFADLIMDSQPPDPYVWATLVRYRTCNVIKPKIEGQAWSFRKLTNCGLEFDLGPYRVRALRTLDGNPPNPGRNDARRQFYAQHHQYQLPFDDVDGVTDETIGANLILDWTTDANRTVLMALSKPIGVWQYKGQPKIEWRKRIEFDDDKNPRFIGSTEDDIDIPPKYDEDEIDQEGEAG